VEFRFNMDWDVDTRPEIEKEIERTAKHECIHLLLWPLYHMAHDRYVKKEELEGIEEEITVRIEELLGD